MNTALLTRTPKKNRRAVKIVCLILYFAFLIALILLINHFMDAAAPYHDETADILRQDIARDEIVLAEQNGRRTVADFQEPVLLKCREDTKLIVYECDISDTVTVSNEAWGGMKWLSAYQQITYHGISRYTVDLSKLTAADFELNNDTKQLTVHIPFVQLEEIEIPTDKIQFQDVEKGWLAPKEIKMTVEQSSQLQANVTQRMKAKLIDRNTADTANTAAKKQIAALLCTVVQNIDPDYTVIAVQ